MRKIRVMFRGRNQVMGLAIATLLALCSAVFGQCDIWSPFPQGIEPSIETLTMHDGDLIAGGLFVSIAGQTVNRIARWDGSAWQPMGSGMDDPVFDLIVYKGDLIAAGSFALAGGEIVFGIARWDGESWHSLGTGMNGYVFHLAVYEGDLIVSGSFTMAGGVPANHIARWDGREWHALEGTSDFEGVGLMAIYDGKLIVGGTFPNSVHIKSWDGKTWQTLGGGVSSSIYSMTVYDNKLIVGGIFNFAGGQLVHQIASWDGVGWVALGSGINAADGVEGISALIVYQGDLIAGGVFDTAGENPASGIARWDGQAWHALGGGVSNRGDHGYVRTFVIDNDQLIVGGHFDTAGGAPASNIALWTGCDGPPPIPCPGDITGSGVVNVTDLQAVIVQWNKTGPNWADADDNGVVDVDDLFTVINGWGVCPQ